MGHAVACVWRRRRSKNWRKNDSKIETNNDADMQGEKKAENKRKRPFLQWLVCPPTYVRHGLEGVLNTKCGSRTAGCNM